jgi:multicomponent Na+:H+ antiporter subunit F
MTELMIIGLVVLLATLALGLFRVVAGPTDADRMMAAQLLGTAGVGLLLILSGLLGAEGLVDVALVLAFLAAVTVIAFTRGAGSRSDVESGHD